MTAPYVPPDSAFYAQATKRDKLPWEAASVLGLVAAGLADYGTTVNGLHKGYPEGNPLMRPFAKAGDIPLALAGAALTAGTSYASHKLKEQGFKGWWIPNVIGILGHGLAAYSNSKTVK